MLRSKLWWVALPVLTVLLFSPVYRAAFVYDDSDFVVENPLLNAPHLDVAAVFTTSYPPQHPEQKLYRPLVTLSYALDKAMWGTPGGFHVTNVLWHLAVVAMLVALLRQLGVPLTGWTLAGAVTFFAWHPLTTEAVAWVAGRAELMAAFFVLASLVAFVRNRPVLAGLTFSAALLCKESAIMTPALAVLLAWRWPVKRRRPVWAGYAGIALAYLVWRQYLFAGVRLEQVAYTGFADAWMQRLVAGKVLARYLALSFVPYPQSVFHEVQVESLRSALAVALLAGVTVWLWWRRDRYPNLLLGWTWFFVALVPVSNLIFPIGSVMAERFTYLPLIGVSLALAGMRWRWWIIVFAVVLAHNAVKTFMRSFNWQTDRQLWQSAVAVEPNAFLPHAQLGFATFDKMEFDRALALLEAEPPALRQHFEPRIQAAELELVHRLARQQQFAAAIAGYQEFLRQWPGDARARRALMDCQLELHDFAAATSGLADLVWEFPNDARLRAKFGSALNGIGQIEEACRQLERAVELEPSTIIYRQHLAALREHQAHVDVEQRRGE